MTTLTFQDKTLQVIDCDGRQWLTIRDITAALYPVDKGGAQSDAPFARFERQMLIPRVIIQGETRYKSDFGNPQIWKHCCECWQRPPVRAAFFC